MEKTNSTKKLKITVIALCCAVFVLIGAVIGIWAATSQRVKASFTVDYSIGENIATAVRTEYYVPNLDSDGDGVEDGVVTVTTDKEGNTVTDEKGYVTYNAADEQTSKYVYIGDFTLNPKMKTVIFYFTVESLMSEDYIRVLLEQDITKTNVRIETYYYNTDSFTSSTSASRVADDSWTNVHYQNVGESEFKLIKVVVSVVDVNSKASCAGDFNLNLEYSSVNELATLDTALISNNYSGEPTIAFEYEKETPTTSAATLADSTTDKIWTYSDGSTFYIYSKYTIDLPADCSELFYGYDIVESFDFTNINTSNVTNMSSMFEGCNSLSGLLDLTYFDTSNVTSMYAMFRNMIVIFGSGSTITIELSSFNTSNVTNMAEMFLGSDVNVDVSGFDTSKVTDMSWMFSSDLDGFGSTPSFTVTSNFDTSNVTNMSYMFYGTDASQEDIANFDTTNATDLSGMFAGCYSVASLDLTHFDTSNVTNMAAMFDGCKATSLDLSSFDTSNVTTMRMMFRACGVTSLDLTNFNTSNVTKMDGMFNSCKKLASLDLSNFNTANVTTMSGMFQECSNLQTIYVGSNWTTAKVTSSSSMFYGCASLPNYTSSKVDKTYAYAGGSGYLTLK